MKKRATWVNGNRKITGYYSYYRPADRFDIVLDSKDPITGRQRSLSVHGDEPEWGGWKLKRGSSRADRIERKEHRK